MEESDDPLLEGDEEGDMLLGGGNTARDEDDFFLQGNHFFLRRTQLMKTSWQDHDWVIAWLDCEARSRR